MKKSVVILIAVIYVMAVVLVSFFGIQATLLEETVYVKDIEIINKGVKIADDGITKSIDISFNGKETAEYQIEWRVIPTNATNSKVVFNYGTQQTFATVDENGLVKFTRPGVLKISIVPADGTILEKPATIIIRAMR